MLHTSLVLQFVTGGVMWAELWQDILVLRAEQSFATVLPKGEEGGTPLSQGWLVLGQ